MNLLDTFTEMDHARDATFCEDPAGIARTLAARFRPVAEKKGMEIVQSIDPSPPIAVPKWVVEQTLENLVTNALKFSPPGTRVWLSFDSDESEAWFTVRDEGPGFSKQDRKKIFQRYSRLSAKPTGSENSTGIGLSIAKRLADQNGGTLELLSPAGKGAEFRLCFPVR